MTEGRGGLQGHKEEEKKEKRRWEAEGGCWCELETREVGGLGFWGLKACDSSSSSCLREWTPLKLLQKSSRREQKTVEAYGGRRWLVRFLNWKSGPVCVLGRTTPFMDNIYTSTGIRYPSRAFSFSFFWKNINLYFGLRACSSRSKSIFWPN